MLNNFKKQIEPKVYALLLKSPETIFLSVQYAYSLEEAFVLSKLEFEKHNPTRTGFSNPLMGAEIGLFTIKTIRELMETNRPPLTNTTKKVENVIPSPVATAMGPEPAEVKKIKLLPTQAEKNILMKEIIDKKDLKKFRENKDVFSEVEVKYIRGELRK
jgi:hypothetical protein